MTWFTIIMLTQLLVLSLVGIALIHIGRVLWSWEPKKPKKKPECQSCVNFIPCSMAGVTECPLLQ